MLPSFRTRKFKFDKALDTHSKASDSVKHLQAGLWLGLLWGSVASSAAAVLRVPGDHPRIQPALDAAATGDTVLVGEGVWSGPGNVDLNFGGKGIELRSESGPLACELDCNYQARAVALIRGERGAKIDGFLIRNGRVPGSAAILVSGGQATISNCMLWFDGTVRGVGLSINAGSHVVIEGCLFTGATTGLSASNADADVRRCMFLGNEYCNAIDFSSGSLRISDSLITGYHSLAYTAIACLNSKLDMERSSVVLNSSHECGPGMRISSNSRAWFHDSIIMAGSGRSLGPDGGYVCIDLSSSVEVSHAALGSDVTLFPLSQVVIGPTVSYDGVDMPLPLSGKLAGEPQARPDRKHWVVTDPSQNWRTNEHRGRFVRTTRWFGIPVVNCNRIVANTATTLTLLGPMTDRSDMAYVIYDVRPAPRAAVIDAGDPAAEIPRDALDLVGNPRVWDSDEDGLARHDLGAFERIVPPPGDLNCDGRVNFDDVDGFVLALIGEAAFAEAFPGCDLLAGDLDGDQRVSFADIDGFVAVIIGG